MRLQLPHMSARPDHVAHRHGWDFWLAVIVAILVLLACTGPTGGFALAA